MSANDTQVGGDHYKDMGPYQPWDVLRAWLTPEEYRGWMKGNAIVYLAREGQKGGDVDIGKAAHHLQKLLEVLEDPDGATDLMPDWLGKDAVRVERFTYERSVPGVVQP